MLLTYQIQVSDDHQLLLRCVKLDIEEGDPFSGTPYPLRPDQLLNKPPGDLRLTARDRKLLMTAVIHQKKGGTDSLFTGADAARLLQTVIETGRAYPAGKHHPPLRADGVREVRPTWSAEDGRLKPSVDLPPDLDLVPGLPCHAIERATGRCSRLRAPLPDPVLLRWVATPALPPEETAAWLEDMSRRHPAADFPAAPGLEVQTVEDLAPIPFLRIDPADPVRHLPMLARLEFHYGPVRVEDHAPGGRVRWTENGGLLEAAREPVFEENCRKRLLANGLNPHEPPADNLFARAESASGYALDPDRHSHWASFVLEEIPGLRDHGWRVDLPASLIPREIGEDEWYAEFHSGRSGSTLRFEQGILVDGKRVNLLPVFRDFLQRQTRRRLDDILADIPDAPTPLPSEAGLLLIPGERFRRLVRTLFEVLGPDSLDRNRRLRLSEWQATELVSDETEGWTPPPELLARARSLRERPPLEPLDPVASFQGILRPYQRDGLGWIEFLYRHRLGGILADDMGLGKTVQVLAALLQIREVHQNPEPFLIVSPASVLPNWRRECGRFAPELRIHTHHGTGRHANPRAREKADVWLTTYGTLHRDIDALAETRFAAVILDEAQAVKNPRARVSRAVRKLKGDLRLALSGTPLENHLGELHSLFQFAAPGYLGGESLFNSLFRRPIEQDDCPTARDRLHRRVNPLLLRRRKDAVATDLPPKTEIIREIELTPEQRDEYEVIRTSGQRELSETFREKGFEQSRMHALDLLLKLRQVCCDPRLRKRCGAFAPEHSAKLAWLREALPELIEEGRRVLLFSQFTSMLDLIHPELRTLGIPWVELRGDTRDREKPVRTFQEGKVPLFLISLKAGGTGLNLTAADTVIFYDPWWNPAVEAQAADRAHRIGQEKPVFIYKLICRGTVEARVLELQQRKRDLQGLIGDRGGASPAFTESDFQSLLSPLDAEG